MAIGMAGPLGIMPGEHDWMRNIGGGGIFGPAPQPVPTGLLGRVANQFSTGINRLQTDPTAQLGLRMLANSGYSPQKRGLGEIFGASVLQQQQAQAQGQDDELRRQFIQAQIEAMRNPARGNAPASVQEYEYAKRTGFQGTFEDWKRSAIERQDVGAPASVREWEHFSKLSPEDQQRYLQMKRALQIETIQQVPTVVGLGGSTTPLSSLPEEASAAATMAGAKKAGEVRGGAQAQAAVDLPQVEENAKIAIDLLDKIKTHPGLDYGVGLWSKVPVVPGTPQADFVILVEQMRGKQFLEAYQTLKGGGQITEVEGKKAEDAIARMNRAQSKGAFLEAATEFQDIIRRGLERQRKKAGLTSETPGNSDATPKFRDGQTATNPRTGERMIFKDGRWQKM